MYVYLYVLLFMRHWVARTDARTCSKCRIVRGTLTATLTAYTVLMTWQTFIGLFPGRFGLLSPFKSDLVVVPKVRWSLSHHISILSNSFIHYY